MDGEPPEARHSAEFNASPESEPFPKVRERSIDVRVGEQTYNSQEIEPILDHSEGNKSIKSGIKEHIVYLSWYALKIITNVVDEKNFVPFNLSFFKKKKVWRYLFSLLQWIFSIGFDLV